MGPRITMHLDEQQKALIDNFLKQFPRDAPRAIMRACNRTAIHARKLMIGVLKRNLAVSRTGLLRGGLIRLAKATIANLGARLSFTGKRLRLIEFGARQLPGRMVNMSSVRTGQTRKRWIGGGVTYRMRPGGPRSWAPLFIGRFKSGHVGAYKRVGPKRSQIEERFGPSEPHALIHDPATGPAVHQDSAGWFIKQLHSQLKLVMATLLRRANAGDAGYEDDGGDTEGL